MFQISLSEVEGEILSSTNSVNFFVLIFLIFFLTVFSVLISLERFSRVGFFKSVLVASLRVLIRVIHSSSHQGAFEGRFQKDSVILMLCGLISSSNVGPIEKIT